MLLVLLETTRIGIARCYIFTPSVASVDRYDTVSDAHGMTMSNELMGWWKYLLLYKSNVNCN